MLIKRRRSWELPDSAATPEALYLDRRQWLKGAAGGSILAASALLAAPLRAQEGDPSAGLYPVKRNEAYTLDRPVTQERLAITYNNFYEYGTDKSIVSDARRLQIRPWTVKIDGMVEKEMEIGIDGLLAKMPLEERLYRHRCVETWSMAVPWSGFALKALVDMAKPLGSAKYLQMQTFKDVRMAPGQRDFLYPWPYTEGLTVAEATNELAFIATGLYGKPIPKQNGAPLRLAVPWKYGFKSVKSIVRFTFTDKRPRSFWETLQGSEYGFWANVNPEVAHPRWSQATEKPLGSEERVPTLLYNGYGEQVAHLYKDMAGERLFM
ncbi:MAG: protein-methionine-sulfoxide reductase catalytic subunit MsrP [Reyranellaceae bacterium]